jgi:16S rRNA (guanine966-N2)-methyltransferase
VREAVFNALGSLDLLVDATVLDLFAGSGALGIEALSRGAAHCTFVDSTRAAIDAVRANLTATGLAARATVVTTDALAYARSHRDPVELALLDPPYAFDAWPVLLDLVAASFVVIESDREIDPGEAWDVVRTRRYGSTVVTFARRSRAEGDQQEGPG